MNKYKLIEYLILLAVLTTTQASTVAKPEFLVHPKSVNVTSNTLVMFTCTANNTDSITYRVNNAPVDIAGVREEGLNQFQPEVIGQGLIRRNLSLLIKPEYNNTEILCEADGNGVQVDVNSKPAKIMIQGRLSSVVDLHASQHDPSTVTISWSPPFTLPGTDITGYNISATSSDDTIIVNDFASGTTHSIRIKTRSIHTVAVSAFNGIDGHVTTMNIKSQEPMACNDSNVLCILLTSLALGIVFFVVLIVMIVVVLRVVVKRNNNKPAA